MSTNIKLLIALLLGAAIGALVMKQTSITEIESSEQKELKDSSSTNLDKKITLEIAKPLLDTKPLDFTTALGMVRNQEVDALLNSKALYTLDGVNRLAIKSWLMDKDYVLRLLGIEEFEDMDKEVHGMRCYVGFNKDSKRGELGYTLVCMPADSVGNVIRRNNGRANPAQFPEGIEYHMPCPKNCGTPNHMNDLSRH